MWNFWLKSQRFFEGDLTCEIPEWRELFVDVTNDIPVAFFEIITRVTQSCKRLGAVQ